MNPTTTRILAAILFVGVAATAAGCGKATSGQLPSADEARQFATRIAQAAKADPSQVRYMLASICGEQATCLGACAEAIDRLAVVDPPTRADYLGEHCPEVKAAIGTAKGDEAQQKVDELVRARLSKYSTSVVEALPDAERPAFLKSATAVGLTLPAK